MSGFKEPSFADRQKAAQEARQNILNKFRAKPGHDDPLVQQRQAEREAQAADRAKAKLVRDAAKALKLALGITLIASTIYVAVWLVEFYVFIPDFMDKYTAAHLQQVKSSGLSPADLQKQVADMERMRDVYDHNPLVVVLYTYLEIVPVGLIISLLTALLLKRKHRPSRASAAIA